MHRQVVVIGGGPIGAVAARHAAEAGADVLLVERRARPAPIPACTGLVSPRTIPALGVSDRSVLREIRALTAHAPGGRTLRLRSMETKAVVVDRRALEQELHALAAAAGAELRAGTEARVAGDGRVVLESHSESETVDPEVVIGADGPDSAVARAAGLATGADFLFGIQAVVEVPDLEPDCVDVYFEKDVSLFAWCVPAEEGRARVGLLAPSDADPARLLAGLLARRFADRRVVARAGGQIPMSAVSRSVAGRFLLVGDAAGQVKPLSGGGLYTGARCARIAGRAAALAAASGSDLANVLATYDVTWRAELGRDLAFGQTLRNVLVASSETDLDRLFGVLDDREVLRFVADVGDIDHMGRLLSELARQPALWGKLIGLLSLIDQRKIDALIARPAVVPSSQRTL
ncbi:geranylgeranyl reductase family protein [Candidatus Bipolaricaulota bacterium]